MMDRAGTGSPLGVQNIPFAAGNAASATTYGLLYADPANLPSAYNVTNYAANQLATAGATAADTTYDLATINEYTSGASGGTAWSNRFWIYAYASGSDAALYSVDLRQLGTATPAPVQLAGGTVKSLQLCKTNPPSTVLDDYASATNSWIVFHALGGDNNCGTLDDQFVAVNPVGGAKTLGYLEPVDAAYDPTTGAITGYLAINHPPAPLPLVTPTGPVHLQQLDLTLTAVSTLPGNLVGYGFNANVTPSGDFLSLGVSSSKAWLYFDSNNVSVANLAASPVVITPLALSSGDSVSSRAIFDGNFAWVAVNHSGAAYILQIDLTNPSAPAIHQSPTEAVNGLTLVGVTPNYVVYALNDGSALKSLAKSALTPTVLWSKPSSSSETVDGPMAAAGTGGAPTAYLVGTTVYFTVADPAASGSAGFAKQAFYVDASGSPAATPLSATVSAVLGLVAPSPVPTSGSVTYTGAIVLTGGVNATTPTLAAFAGPSISAPASLSLYGAGGALTNSIGTLPVNNPTGATRVNPVYGAALATGPVQAGGPATLRFFGTDASGAAAIDLAIFSSDGTSTPFTPISGFIY